MKLVNVEKAEMVKVVDEPMKGESSHNIGEDLWYEVLE